MVIHYLDLMGIAILPYEADSPLIIDPNTVLTSSIAV
jgi:hypothetical protein